MPSALILSPLRCRKCGKLLVKEGMLKCLWSKCGQEVQVELGKDKIFCPILHRDPKNPQKTIKVLLAKRDQAVCPRCGELTPMLQKEEKVETKKFRGIRDWDEWLELWKNNDIREIAIGLLQVGFAAPQSFRVTGGEEAREKSKFYFEIVKAFYGMSPYTDDYRIGDVAFKYWIQQLLAHYCLYSPSWWDSSPEEISYFEEIVDFLAERYEAERYESSNTEVKKLIESLWGLPKDYYLNTRTQQEKTQKRFLAKKKEALTKILLTLEDYEFLYKHNLLKVKAPQVKAKWK